MAKTTTAKTVISHVGNSVSVKLDAPSQANAPAISASLLAMSNAAPKSAKSTQTARLVTPAYKANTAGPPTKDKAPEPKPVP
jgi:hypothetical protein